MDASRCPSKSAVQGTSGAPRWDLNGLGLRRQPPARMRFSEAVVGFKSLFPLLEAPEVSHGQELDPAHDQVAGERVPEPGLGFRPLCSLVRLLSSRWLSRFSAVVGTRSRTGVSWTPESSRFVLTEASWSSSAIPMEAEAGPSTAVRADAPASSTWMLERPGVCGVPREGSASEVRWGREFARLDRKSGVTRRRIPVPTQCPRRARTPADSSRLRRTGAE
jgi:hypothetical protein